MDINIDSKRNNPLLNRTEIHFTVKHKGEKTPNRELVRTELADKLNAKKENIIVNYINPSFGLSESTGYAKIYDSQSKLKNQEREYMLNRNNLGKSKKEKPKEKEEKPSEKPKEEIKKEEQPQEEKPKETEEKPDKKEEPEESKEKQEEKVESPKEEKETQKEEKKENEGSEEKSDDQKSNEKKE